MAASSQRQQHSSDVNGGPTSQDSSARTIVDSVHDVDLSQKNESSLAHLGYLKDLITDKKQTKDGQTPKRRGPKPDSKPAMTRRQELNRQAQRTHRERKEMYIKALEAEVLRLKELYTKSVKERDAVVEENRRLRELLSKHGIAHEAGNSPLQFHQDRTNYNTSSSGSISGSYRPDSDSTGFSPTNAVSQPVQYHSDSSPHSQRHVSPPNLAQIPSNRLDYDQTGIDFVLTYDSQGQPLHRVAPYPSPPPQS